MKRSSIRFRTSMNLIVLSFVIITCFWLAQILMFRLTSQTMTSYLISSVGRDMIEEFEGYPSLEFRAKLKGCADKYGLNATFFSASIDEEDNEVLATYVIYSVSPFSDDVMGYGNAVVWNEEQFDAFFVRRIFQDQREFSYTINSPPTLVFGAQFVAEQYGTTIYAYFETNRSVSNLSFSTTLIQLALASLVCILIAILIAIIYSKQFSRPIVSFSSAAESLAHGRYENVRFQQSGIKEIDSLADSLTYAAAEIKKTDEFRREFLANITHDLRTPITMMRGYAEMIRDISGDKKEKRNAHAQIIIDESERLSLLVEDILLMSKLESKTLKMTPTAFDISVLAATVVERFKIKTLTEGYLFVTQITPSLTVIADMQRIEQVLYNLIANAVNYAGADKQVIVKVFETEDGTVRVEVSDNGKGISPEDLDLIWDRYYRINQNTRKVIGSGIGLNIVKGILESFKALYGVESTVGKGTTFWFEL